MQLASTIRFVRLVDECPLAFLNAAFPSGIPVSPVLLSIDGQDFYQLSPEKLPDQDTLTNLGKAICASGYPSLLLYALFSYGVVAVPAHWELHSVEVTPPSEAMTL